MKGGAFSNLYTLRDCLYAICWPNDPNPIMSKWTGDSFCSNVRIESFYLAFWKEGMLETRDRTLLSGFLQQRDDGKT